MDDGLTPVSSDETRRSNLFRKVVVLVLAVLVSFCAVPYIVTFFYPWTELNCTQESIDIMSGRCRTERFFWWVRLSDRVTETELSEAYRKHVGEPPAPVWRRVNTFSGLRRRSPHYRYHSAFAASRKLMTAMQRVKFSDGAVKMAVTTFLGLLQSDGDDGLADEYASDVVMLVMRWYDAHDSTIEVEDLPKPRGHGTNNP